MAFHNPAFDTYLPPVTRNTTSHTHRHGTVSSRYRLGNERDSETTENIYEEIHDNTDTKYETIKTTPVDEHGYAHLGKDARANISIYQTLQGGVGQNPAYASLRNDNTPYGEPPPYDNIDQEPGYVTVKAQGSFFRAHMCKILIIVLLCVAVLVGGIIIGLIISEKHSDGDKHDDSSPMTSTGTTPTKSITATPTTFTTTTKNNPTSTLLPTVTSTTKKNPTSTLFSTVTSTTKKNPTSTSTVTSTTSTLASTVTSTTTTSSSVSTVSTTSSSVSTTMSTQRITVTVPSEPGDAILVSYGVWSSWLSWSGCSTSCGDGFQSRQRQCEKQSTDLDCPGRDAETRQCNLGNCPECDRACTGSLIQEDCLSCHCVNSPIRHFRVVNKQTTPIGGATVAKVDVPRNVLATTASDGRAQISNACVGDVYLIRKDRFEDATVIVSNITDYLLIMEATENLEMKEHPKDLVALVGENRNLSCLASGKPQPSKYEWFKNGQPLDPQVYTSHGNVLYLRDMIKQDGGFYSCRATSDYGVVLSKSALVIVKDDGDAFCEKTPKDYMKTLPKDCPQSGSIFEYNVKRCANNVCTKSAPIEGASYCCGPTKQEKKQLSCNGYQLDLVVVLECGCIVCNMFNIGSTVTTMSSEITFSGRAFDLLDPMTALSFGDVFMNGEYVASTGFDGSFSFVVPKDNLRVVLTLSEVSIFPRGFINTTKVFYIPTGFTGTFYRDFPMMRTSDVTVLYSFSENTLTLAKTETDEPLADVVIPPNVYYSKDGDQYTGKVEASVRFIDPRNITDYENTVGDLTYVDENGQVGGLQTFGMFHLDIKDTDGNQLGIQGSVEMAISADFIGVSDPTATTSVKLWSLNPNTGRWELEGTLTRGTAVNRRKRSQSNYDSTFFIGNVVITDRYWFNFDNDELNYCYVKLKTYSDMSFTTELPWNPNLEATVIAIDSSQTGQWAQITTGSMSFDGFTGASSDGDCILTVCGNNKFSGYLMVDDQDGPFRGSSTLGGAQTSPAGVVQLTTTSLGHGSNALSYDRAINTTVSPLTSNGPLYHQGNSMCYDPSSTFCNYCFTVQWSPTCVLCDSRTCQYPAAVSYANCIAGNSTSIPHYRFYKDTSLYEFTVCKTYINCPTSPELIWYPPINTAWAWFIKVQVLVLEQSYVYDVVKQEYVWKNTTLPDESVVRAISRGGTQPMTKDKIFGIREDTTKQQATCLEFKGSGDIIYTENGQPQRGPDETFVEIKVQGTNCRIDWVLQGLKVYEQPHSGIFGFKLPDGTISGGDATGVYFKDNADPDTAARIARARCMCADIQHGSPNCADDKPDEGVGLKIVCDKDGP